MIRVLGTILTGLLGLAFGSFLNVCVSRWPAGESVVRPASHCRGCGRTLRWWENVPVLSWLALRGQCRTCGVRIGVRYVLVEATVGALWAMAAWRAWDAPFPFAYGIGLCFLAWVLVALAALDAEHLWIPDAITLPGAAVGFLWWLAQAELGGWPRHTLKLPWGDAEAMGARLLAIAVSAGLILAIRWTYWLVRRREGIGLGDAKLMALLGAWLGLPGALLAFALGVLLGAIAAVALLLIPHRSEGTWGAMRLPLGTFLCAGGMVSAFWGQPLIAAYLRLAGF